MASISKIAFFNASPIKIFELEFKFHWSLFLKYQLSVSQHWPRLWLGTLHATSHYLNWCSQDLYCHIDGLVQERRNSIANALELHLSCTNPWISGQVATIPPLCVQGMVGLLCCSTPDEPNCSVISEHSQITSSILRWPGFCHLWTIYDHRDMLMPKSDSNAFYCHKS